MAEGKQVGDVMTRQVEVARADMTIWDAAEKMRSRHIGSLPVCEENRVVGVVTDRDITVRATAHGRNPSETRVADVMTKGTIFTVGEDVPLEEAEKIMHDQQIRRLPVVNAAGNLVGYLSQAKVARTEDETHVGRVLKGISQPEKPQPMESYGRKRRRKTG